MEKIIYNLAFIVVLGVFVIVFVQEFKNAFKKISDDPLLRNFSLLLLLSYIVAVFHKEFEKALWFLDIQTTKLSSLIIIYLNATGTIANFCYVVAILLMSIIPWVIVYFVYPLIFKKKFNAMLNCIWGSWLLLVISWVRL